MAFGDCLQKIDVQSSLAEFRLDRKGPKQSPLFELPEEWLTLGLEEARNAQDAFSPKVVRAMEEHELEIPPNARPMSCFGALAMANSFHDASGTSFVETRLKHFLTRADANLREIISADPAFSDLVDRYGSWDLLVEFLFKSSHWPSLFAAKCFACKILMFCLKSIL